MLKHEIYSIYDSKADSWWLPVFSVNDAVAARQFTDALMDERSDLGKHPEDYTLFHVGSFSVVDGVIEAVTPRSIVNGLVALTRVKAEVN